MTRPPVFQSTHPRGVRPGSGRTAHRPGPPVSIHAPARGATASMCGTRSRSRCFNPRTREGCDIRQEKLGRYRCPVSIHAPARGATLGWRRGVHPVACFNPRTREGCDGGNTMRVGRPEMFQSTHPRGVRRPAVTPGAPAHQVSIHAPARGATWILDAVCDL